MMLPINIVLVHGAGGGAWEWRLWQDVFEGLGWQVVAGELQPGNGGIAHTDADEYVFQIRAWVERLSHHQLPPFLVGASLGGILALKAAERVDLSGLVLVNAIPPQGMGGWPRAQVDFPAVVDWSARETVHDALCAMPDSNDQLLDLFDASWRDESGAVLRAVYKGVSVERPRMPCLVIAGAKDTEVAPSFGAAMAAAYGGDFFCVSGVSHLGALMGKRAEAVAGFVASWIESQLLDGISLSEG